MKRISLLFLLFVLGAAAPYRLHAGDGRDPFRELAALRNERAKKIERVEKIRRGEGCPPLTPKFMKQKKIGKLQAEIGGMTRKIRALKEEIDKFKYEIVEIKVSYERGDIVVRAPKISGGPISSDSGDVIIIRSSMLPPLIVGSPRTLKVLVSGTKVNDVIDSDSVILNIHNVVPKYRGEMKFRKNRGVSISLEDYLKPMVGRGEWKKIGTFNLEPEDINWLEMTKEGHWGRYKYTVKLRKCD